MEEQIINVLSNIRNDLSNDLEIKAKELLEPLNKISSKLSAVEKHPLEISTLSIEEIEKNFKNVSKELIEKLNVYKMLSQFEYFILTEEQKTEITNIMKDFNEQLDKIKGNIINSNTILKDSNSKIDEIDKYMEKIQKLYANEEYLNSDDITSIANILKESSIPISEQTKILQELGILSIKLINSDKLEETEEEVYTIEETNLDKEELSEVFTKYGYKLEDFKARDQSKLLKYGNLLVISQILEVLKNNHIYIDIKEFSHKLTPILINSDETIISTILENIKKDYEDAASESKGNYSSFHELSPERMFAECLNAPSIFIKGKHEYKKRVTESKGGSVGENNNSDLVYGSYDNYIKNRELLIKKGVDINKVVMKCLTLLSMPYQKVKENFDSFEFYQIPRAVYSNTLSSLKAADPLSAIDQFIELGCYEYVLSNFSYVNHRPDDLMFYRIVKATQLGEPIYSDRNTRNVELLGKISNDKKNGYSINKDNKEKVVEQFIPEFNPIYDEVVSKDRNAGPVILTYRNYFITTLEDKYKMDDLRYDFNGVIISRFKVLRIYETLMKNRVAGTYNAVLYAICKNSILTEEQYKNITDCLDRAYGSNLREVARR